MRIQGISADSFAMINESFGGICPILFSPSSLSPLNFMLFPACDDEDDARGLLCEPDAAGAAGANGDDGKSGVVLEG